MLVVGLASFLAFPTPKPFLFSSEPTGSTALPGSDFFFNIF